MNHASTVLARLTERGITVRLEGSILVPRGPRGALSSELLDEVRRHKQAIVELLQWPAPHYRDGLAQRVADIADAYLERTAIVMESGNICWSEARLIAEAEVGRRFVETFLPSEIAS
jgi:hypothetical protein